MGAWGFGIFENDDALDWVGKFCDGPSIALVIATLEQVTELGQTYLEMPEAAAALAAAEVVAALKRKPCLNLPEDLSNWVNQQSVLEDIQLVTISLAAIERVEANSELREVWEDSGCLAQWSQSIHELEARLRSD